MHDPAVRGAVEVVVAQGTTARRVIAWAGVESIQNVRQARKSKVSEA